MEWTTVVGHSRSKSESSPDGWRCSGCWSNVITCPSRVVRLWLTSVALTRAPMIRDVCRSAIRNIRQSWPSCWQTMAYWLNAMACALCFVRTSLANTTPTRKASMMAPKIAYPKTTHVNLKLSTNLQGQKFPTWTVSVKMAAPHCSVTLENPNPIVVYYGRLEY